MRYIIDNANNKGDSENECERLAGDCNAFA